MYSAAQTIWKTLSTNLKNLNFNTTYLTDKVNAILNRSDLSHIFFKYEFLLITEYKMSEWNDLPKKEKENQVEHDILGITNWRSETRNRSG